MPSFTATNSIDVVGSQVVTGGLTIGVVTQGAEVTSGLKVTTGGATIDAGGLTVTLGGATVSAGGLTVSAGAATVPYLSLTGLSSDVNAGARFVGGIASGAPLGGSYLVGDVVVDRTGKIWICTTAGSPGTWTQVSGSGGGGSSGTTTNALTIGAGLSGTSSTFNGSAANTISLNVGNANTWTAAQKFNAGIAVNDPNGIGLFEVQSFSNTVYSIDAGSSQITHYSHAFGGSVPSQTWWFDNTAGTNVYKIATLNASGLAVGGSHNPQQAIDIKGVLRLNGTTANTNYTQLQSAATPSTNMTYTFPATAPSAGQILSSDASGNLSWVTNSGGGSGGASLSVANTWTAKQTFSNKIALSDSSASPAPFWGNALPNGLTLASGDTSTSVWTVDPESGIVIGLFTSSADSIGMPTINGMAIAAPSYDYSAVGTVDSTYNGAFEISSALRLKSSATATDFVELRAPAGASSSASYVLPNNLPAKDGYILNATTQGQMTWQYQNAIEPIIADDISPYFNGSAAVFPLTNNLVKISNIIDSKDAEVIVNGRRLVPYVQELRYPWIAEYDAYRGFRVRDGKLILFNAPKSGEQASVMVKTISQKVATRKYPFSASTIALGD